MPAFLTTQNLPPATNTQAISAATGVENSKNSNTSNTSTQEAGSFSELYNESMGENNANENLSGAISNGENQPAIATPGSLDGKPEGQAASELLSNGNNFPGDEYNPISAVDALDLKNTGNTKKEGSNSVVGQGLARLDFQGDLSKSNDKMAGPEGVSTRPNEVSDNRSQLAILSSRQTTNPELPVKDITNPGVSLTTQEGLQEKDGTGKQQSGTASQNVGSLVTDSRPVEIGNQAALDQIKNSVSLENPNPINNPLPLKTLQRSQAKGDIEDRVSSINTRASLLKGIDTDSAHLLDKVLDKVKPMAKDTAKELNLPVLNQGLRPFAMQNIESPNGLSKDFKSIISSQYATISAEAAVNIGEDTDNLSLHTQTAIPKSGLGLSNVMMPTASVTSIVTPNIGSSAWSAEFSQQIVIFSQKGIQQANLQLNPQHLGPMEVRISIGNEQQVNVSFNTQHGAVKEAIDFALPRLREMFEQQGLNLGDVNVSNHSEQNSRQQKFNNNEFPPTATVETSVDSIAEERAQLLTDSQSNYLVDYYA